MLNRASALVRARTTSIMFDVAVRREAGSGGRRALYIHSVLALFAIFRETASGTGGSSPPRRFSPLAHYPSRVPPTKASSVPRLTVLLHLPLSLPPSIAVSHHWRSSSHRHIARFVSLTITRPNKLRAASRASFLPSLRCNPPAHPHSASPGISNPGLGIRTD